MEFIILLLFFIIYFLYLNYLLHIGDVCEHEYEIEEIEIFKDQSYKTVESCKRCGNTKTTLL